MSGNPNFTAKVTTEQVLEAWTSVHPDTRISKRMAETAGKLGVSPATVRRHLESAGIVGQPAAIKQAAQESAAKFIPLRPMPLSGTLVQSAGLILADTITRQREAVAGLLDTEARLSSMLSDLTRGCVDEAGNPLPTDEGVLHRAVSSYARLVDAISKRTELERKVWGIRDDEGSSYAQTLEELAGPPPPSGTPPPDLSGT